jgi:hypothetical protein
MALFAASPGVGCVSLVWLEDLTSWTMSCSPFNLTSSAVRSSDADCSSSESGFGGYPYLTSKEDSDVSVSIVLSSVSIVAESSRVTVEDLPDGPRIRILILFCEREEVAENESSRIRAFQRRISGRAM